MAWILVCILRTYRPYNPTVKFLKYELNNKLLNGVILLRVTPSVTWIQPYTHTHTHTHIEKLSWNKLKYDHFNNILVFLNKKMPNNKGRNLLILNLIKAHINNNKFERDVTHRINNKTIMQWFQNMKPCNYKT